MRFVIDEMLPRRVTEHLKTRGHDAFAPVDLGGGRVSDETIIDIAVAERLVIVTENARDFAHVTTCPVVFVRRSWWPMPGLASRLADALDRWAAANPDPGPWPRWLEAEFR